MWFSDARNHPVMSTATASTVGKVSGFVVDPATTSVVALRLKKTQGDGDTLHWADVLGFGPDAVTVAGDTAIREAQGRAAELAGKDHELLGKRVLDDRGDEHGKVEDVDLDPATGRVVTIATSAGAVAGDRLIGCGSYAVVVRAGTPSA